MCGDESLLIVTTQRDSNSLRVSYRRPGEDWAHIEMDGGPDDLVDMLTEAAVEMTGAPVWDGVS